jgi:hypothetical protein
MLILQRVKSTFALAFSTILLSSGLVSCGSNGESGLMPSTSQTQIRSLRSVSAATPWGSNTCVKATSSNITCYLAFGGSASVSLPQEQISLGDNSCHGSWVPGWTNNPEPATISATFSKQSGSGACGTNVSATITYHDSSPANTPEWKNYDVVGGPNYSYTWCEKILVNECAGPNGSDGAPGITVWVDAPQTLTPSSQIYAFALSLAAQPLNTRGLYGAPRRKECVAALQAVLEAADLSQMLDSQGHPVLDVATFITDLLTSGYSQTTSPGEGDIVELAAGKPGTGEHVGICTNGGCTTMISNSSTPGTFTWGYADGQTTANQNASYGQGSPLFYHHP